jgi:hypothetical protein
MTHALVNVPAKAKRDEIIEIKTLVSHPMETGYRRDNVGNAIRAISSAGSPARIMMWKCSARICSPRFPRTHSSPSIRSRQRAG